MYTSEPHEVVFCVLPIMRSMTVALWLEQHYGAQKVHGKYDVRPPVWAEGFTRVMMVRNPYHRHFEHWYRRAVQGRWHNSEIGKPRWQAVHESGGAEPTSFLPFLQQPFHLPLSDVADMFEPDHVIKHESYAVDIRALPFFDARLPLPNNERYVTKSGAGVDIEALDIFSMFPKTGPECTYIRSRYADDFSRFGYDA